MTYSLVQSESTASAPVLGVGRNEARGVFSTARSVCSTGWVVIRSDTGVASGTATPSPANICRRCGAGGDHHRIGPDHVTARGPDAGGAAVLDPYGGGTGIGDELPTMFGEVLRQELHQARQIDPAFTWVPEGAGVWDGGGIDAGRVGGDLVTAE